MTNKQIIIDGVDVKKCVYHESGYCTISKEAYCYCCDKPTCHYKNWQHKEQECEELKKGLNLILTVQKNCKECPHQKLDVDVLVCDLDCATAFKKIAKQTLKKLENKNV